MSLCTLHAHAFGSLGFVYSLSGLCDSCLCKNELSMPNMMTLLLEQISSNSCNLASSRGYMFRSLGPLFVEIKTRIFIRRLLYKGSESAQAVAGLSTTVQDLVG